MLSLDIWWHAWVRILIRPRITMRAILDYQTDYQVLPIAIFLGITSQAGAAMLRYGGLAWQTWVSIILIGPLLGLISIYVGAPILQWCGSITGSEATTPEVRTASAWANVPWILLSAISIPFTLGATILSEIAQAPQASSNPGVILTISIVLIVGGLLLIAGSLWGFLIWFRCYHETFAMERRWTLVALLMQGVILGIPFYFFNRLIAMILG